VDPLGRLAPRELAEWMGRAAIYALPARYEPFGLSVLEAALAGCVLVLGDIPSLREVWGDAAVFVPPDDVDALVAALELLRREPGRRARFAACARVRALEYLPARMAARYLSAYVSLARARRAAGASLAAASVLAPLASPAP
jgi:glycosyltransferase involved in cell wall biosynthesis